MPRPKRCRRICGYPDYWSFAPEGSGNADEAVKACLSGSLAYDPETVCHHHDHEHGEGECGHHGGGCGSHGCH